MKKCALLSVITLAAATAFGGEGFSITSSNSAPGVYKLEWPAEVGQGFILETTPDPLRGSWTTLSLDLATDVTVGRSIPEQGRGFFRAAMLAPGSSPVPPSCVNLIANGNFEADNNNPPSNWFKGGYGNNTRVFVYPVPGNNSSAHAAKIIVSNYISGDAKWYPRNFVVKPNTPYLFNDWYMASVSNNVTVQFADANGNLSYTNLLLPPPSGAWNEATKKFMVPANAVEATVFHAITTDGSLTIDDMSLSYCPTHTNLTEGLVAFTFDDNWRETALNVSNILSASGDRAAFFIIGERIGRTDPTYGVLSANEIKLLYADGFEIDSHTETHPHLASLTPSEAEQDIVIGWNTVHSLNIGPALDFAYPFGERNATVKQKVHEAGLRSAYNTDPAVIYKSSFDLYDLNRYSMHNTDSLTTVKPYLDEAKANKGLFVILCHHVGPNRGTADDQYSITTATFQSIVNYVHSIGLRVVTPGQAYQLLTAD